MSDDHFPFTELDIDALRSQAAKWLSDFNFIERLSLFEANDNHAATSFIIVAEFPFSLKSSEKNGLVSTYFQWCDYCCRFDSPFAPFQKVDILSVYKQPADCKLSEWIWVTIPSDDENDASSIIASYAKPETEFLLKGYPRSFRKEIHEEPETQDGFIDAQSLCRILADGSGYDTKFLCESLQIDVKSLPKRSGRSVFEEKAGTWYFILLRLAMGATFEQKKDSGYIPPSKGEGHLPIYRFDKKTGRYALVTDDERQVRNYNFMQGFIKVDDLRKWFSQYLRIPVPEQMAFTDPGITEIETDPHLRRLHFTGAIWDIYFEGKKYSLSNKAPVRYMIPIIKQPGKSFGCVELCQMVEGSMVKSTATDFEDRLFVQVRTNKHTDEDQQKMRDALEMVLQDYQENPDIYRDKWAKIKKIAENDFGIVTKEKDGQISFSKSKYQASDDSQFTKPLGAVSKNRSRFIDSIKKMPSSEKLYQHFEQALIIKDGCIEYNLPPEDPSWEIIE